MSQTTRATQVSDNGRRFHRATVNLTQKYSHAGGFSPERMLERDGGRLACLGHRTIKNASCPMFFCCDSNPPTKAATPFAVPNWTQNGPQRTQITAKPVRRQTPKKHVDETK
jgi:hypothetical protein